MKKLSTENVAECYSFELALKLSHNVPAKVTVINILLKSYFIKILDTLKFPKILSTADIVNILQIFRNK